MKSYLKIVRPLNLLIMAATMFLMRYCVIRPFLEYNHLHLQVPLPDFVLLVVTTLLIAAGGYVINDYYDIKADMVNKDCGSIIVGTGMTLKEAMRYYIALTFSGFATGLWFSLSMGDWNFFTLFLLIGGLLWFYSTTYKAMILVGNLLVSVLIALVPLLVIVFEMLKFKENFPHLIENGEINYMPIFYFVFAFSAFAFLTNLIREIAKDIQDIKGDRKAGKKTFPVWAGFVKAKVLVSVLLVIEVVVLYGVYYRFLRDDYSLYYLTLAVAFPLLYALYKSLTANREKDFGHVASVLKWTMTGGMGYAFIICLQL